MRHGKRTTINLDDVKLLVRRNEDLVSIPETKHGRKPIEFIALITESHTRNTRITKLRRKCKNRQKESLGEKKENWHPARSPSGHRWWHVCVSRLLFQLYCSMSGKTVVFVRSWRLRGMHNIKIHKINDGSKSLQIETPSTLKRGVKFSTDYFFMATIKWSNVVNSVLSPGICFFHHLIQSYSIGNLLNGLQHTPLLKFLSCFSMRTWTIFFKARSMW